MVEGHQCHRVAHSHRKLLKGHAFKAVSPNQRFTDGAKAIDGKPLTRIEVHGKNLFYFFGEGAATAVMHIHFGMSGHFRVSPLPGPESTPTTRLKLTNDKLGIVAMLSAMTVQHGDLEFYTKHSAKIGPDPLREDADAEVVWQKMRNSKKPVGLILMDQAMISGIGNIYRAEILYKARVHPEQPGNTVDRETFDSLWRHSVLLLQRGFKTGSILTVDPEDAKALGPPWTRRYIYNQTTCGRCSAKVKVWDMAARTVYACPTCQPLIEGVALSPARTGALEKAKPHKKFKSACAPDPPTPKQLTVAELRTKLEALGQPISGKKADLVARLAAASTSPEASKEAAQKQDSTAKVEEEALVTPPVRKRAKAGGAGFAAVLESEDTNGEKVSGMPKTGEPEVTHWNTMGVAMLKAELRKRGMVLAGKKADLVARLEAAAAAGEAAVKPEPAGQPKAPSSQPAPGTAGLGHIATAQEAEEEKEAAGEGKNVEHVALQLDADDPLAVSTPLAKLSGKKRAADAAA